MGSTISLAAALSPLVVDNADSEDEWGANVTAEVGSKPSQSTFDADSLDCTKRLSLPDVTPVHIQAEIVQQEHVSSTRFADLSSMRHSYHDSSPSSSRSRTRDQENLRSHSSHRELRAREVAAHAAELSSLLDKCKLLESTLRTRDKEIHDLRKERDHLLEDRKRMQRKMTQQEAAQATAVANALAAVARSAPTPPPKSSKSRSSTAPRSYPDDSGSSSPESSSTASSYKTYRTSSTSMTSIHGTPTFQDEYIAHLQSFDIFMTKTDSWSGAQVIQAVKDLNSEVFQFAASLAELHYAVDANNGGKRPQMNPNVLSQAKQNTATRLGVPLMHVLSTRDHSQDSSMLVQFALQATLCTIIDRTLAGFYVGFPVKYDQLLSQLYLRMSSSGKFFFPDLHRRSRMMKLIGLYRTTSHVVSVAFLDAQIHHYFIPNARRTSLGRPRGRHHTVGDGYFDSFWNAYTEGKPPESVRIPAPTYRSVGSPDSCGHERTGAEHQL